MTLILDLPDGSITLHGRPKPVNEILTKLPDEVQNTSQTEIIPTLERMQESTLNFIAKFLF
jgi:hypothetical protein